MFLCENLEHLLIRNWVSFIEIKSFTTFILSLVSSTDLEIVQSDQKFCSGVQLKFSRFKLVKEGFSAWVEFIIPQNGEILIGTTELIITHNGEIIHIKTAGVRISEKPL